MTLCGSVSYERFIVHPDDAPCRSHYIEITEDKDSAIFYVTNCCDDEWVWEFWYSKTNYEVVKFLIMDCIAECSTMDELIDALDEVFEEDCADMLFNEAELQEDEIDVDVEFETEIECDGDCENCVCNAINGCDAVDNDTKTEGYNMDKFILEELKKINEKLDKGV